MWAWQCPREGTSEGAAESSGNTVETARNEHDEQGESDSSVRPGPRWQLVHMHRSSPM